MLNLAEYRRKPATLADYLPWACLVAPGVVLNKDGSLQRTVRYRGPDLDSATEAELISTSARLNNVLRRFGSEWALFFEAERAPANDYPVGHFADAASWLVDHEREAAFREEAAHYESHYFLTFLYLPPGDATGATEAFFFDSHTRDERTLDPRHHISHFLTETDRAIDLLSATLAEIAPLDDQETLTYLHTTISFRRHPVAVPATPMHLDGVLCDTPLMGGAEPRLGDRTLRVLTVLGFPNTTTPGLLDALNDLGFSYRWMTRWIAMDKREAAKHLTRLRRQWFSKRKSMTAIVREVMFQRETALVDGDADNKALDADEALQELGSDDVAFGFLTISVVVSDRDPRRAADKLAAVERIINGRGFVTIAENLNAVEAWLGSLPGNPYANVRQPIVHTLNLAHIMPVSAVWAGPSVNQHLRATPLLVTQTRGATPFRLDLHVGDVGHTLIVGPTGSGKSVLVALLALQFRRYAGAQVIVFDKGRSARASILAMGGASIDLGLDGDIAFQPLARIDRPPELAFALDWVLALLSNERVTVTPDVKELVWTALKSLASAPEAERTLTGLAVLIQSNALTQALTPYILEGPYGRLLDASRERLALADIVHLEMDGLMQHKGLILPVLTYLFHRLEERFDGRPTLLVLDEAWVFLDDTLFSSHIRAWLKTLRKRNVSVLFSTQSLADIERSSIASALIESCPTRIFLPNDRAIEPQSRAIYERFGLNARQIELLAQAVPKRDYYVQTTRGNRLFELGLGPIALALTGTSSPADQTLINETLAQAVPAGFAAAFLRAKGLNWAADLLASFDPDRRTSSPPPPLPRSSNSQVEQPSSWKRPDFGFEPKQGLPEKFSPFRVRRSQVRGRHR